MIVHRQHFDGCTVELHAYWYSPPGVIYPDHPDEWIVLKVNGVRNEDSYRCFSRDEAYERYRKMVRATSIEQAAKALGVT